jgi:hypothetical protein
MDEQKPDKLAELVKKYKGMGLSDKQSELLAQNEVSEELEASRAKRMKKGEPLVKAHDEAKAAFDAAFTATKEYKAYQKAKAALDELRNSEKVKPLKDAMNETKEKVDEFFKENPDLRKGRGGTRAGAGRKSGYKGEVEITNIDSGEKKTFNTMNTAYRYVLGLHGEELTHGIGWNQADSAFRQKGWTIRKLGAEPVAAEA